MADNTSTDKQVIHKDGLISDAGQLAIHAIYEEDPTGSSIPIDKSHVTLQDKHKSYLRFISGAVLLRSIADMSIDVGRNYSFSVKGSAQYTYLGDKHEYVKGNKTKVEGDNSTKARQAAQKLNKLTQQTQQAKAEAFKNTQPSKQQCPVCSQEVANNQQSELLAASVLTRINNLLPPHWKFPVDKIKKILGTLFIPFLSITNAIGLTGKDCGNPNCKNGMISTVGAEHYQNANDAAQKHIEQNQEQFDNLSKQVSANASVHVHSGDTHHQYGIGAPNAPDPSHLYVEAESNTARVTRLWKNGNSPLVPGSHGTLAKKKYHIPPDVTSDGNYSVTANNRLSLESGGPGMSLKTAGGCEMLAGHIDILSAHGDMTIASNSLTILKGKNVVIDANDRSGDSSIVLDAKYSFAGGQLSVAGDLSVKGCVIADGGIYVPTVCSRSTACTTDPAAPCLPKAQSPVWNSPPPLTNGYQATVHDTYSTALQTVFDVIDGLDYVLTLEWLSNGIQKVLEKVKLAAPYDNTGLPTGHAHAYNAITQTPLLVSCNPTTGWGIVVPGQMIPMHNGPHAHPMQSGSHTHEYESVAMSNGTGYKGLQSKTPCPSHVPTPAPEPVGTQPGPLSTGGSCGGGGGSLGNPNSNAYKAVFARNQAFGINGMDAYGGTNQVQATVKYNPDGSVVGTDFSLTNVTCN